MDPTTLHYRLLELKEYTQAHTKLRQSLPSVIHTSAADDVMLLILTIEHNVAGILIELGEISPEPGVG